MTAHFPLDLAHGHPIVHAGGLRCLVDTGSPLSFGSGRLSLLGDTFELLPAGGPIALAAIGKAIGTPVDALLGTDILARHRWVFDWPNGRVLVSDQPIPFPGEAIETPPRFGVPCVKIDVAGRPDLAFIDSGAQFSYMDPAAAAGRAPAGEATDFFPALGPFTTPLYEVSISVAGRPFHGRFGVLPALLGAMMVCTGVKWILGLEWLSRQPVLMDLDQGFFVAGPVTPPA